MSNPDDNRTKIGPYIDQRVWDEFKEFVQNKHGKTKGVTSSEVEKALKRHLNQSELQHIDDRLRRLEDALDVDRPTGADGPVGERDSASNADRDPTQDDLTPRTQTKVDNILGQLSGHFDRDQLEAAIENVAGSSFKTKKKYREILTNRCMVVEAPWSDDDVYYQDRSMFAIAATQNMEPGSLHQLQDKLAVHWGEDWVSQELPDDMPNPFDTVDDPDGSGDGRIGFQ